MRIPLASSCAAVLFAAACHSANWTPPEPQHAEPPVATTAPTEQTAPAGSAEPATPPVAAPPTSAAASAAPAATPSTDPQAAALPSASATPPNATGRAKVDAHKEAHKTEPQSASTEAYAGPDPCQGKTFHYSSIGGACKKGGRKAVKEIMRGVVKKAKAAGQDTQCMSCHTDTASYELLPNAVSDLKHWL